MTYQEYTIEEIAREEWRPVVGFEDYFHVSDLGRVKRIKQSGGTRAGRILQGTLGPTGYPQVSLRNGTNKSNFKKIHRLVARAFLPPRNESHDYDVNHKDGNKLNPRVENLEYVTPAENTKHALETGLVARGKRLPQCKIDDNGVRSIRELLKAGKTNKEIALRYGVNQSQISRIRANKRRQSID